MTPITLLLSLASLLLLSSVAQGLLPASCSAVDTGSDLRVFHVSSPCTSFSKPQLLSWEDMQANDKARLLYFSSLVAGRSVVPIASGRDITLSSTYIVRLKIGTPAQQLLVALDTSRTAAWIPCTGCTGCPSATFNAAKSASFKPVRCGSPQCAQVPNNPSCGGATCGFKVTYGSSTISATLAQDNISLAADSVHGYTFGCVKKTTASSFPGQGLLGLGRGPLSLLSQSNNLYQSIFSYCLPSYKSTNFTGSLRLGPKSQPIRIKTTQLLKNPRRSSLYYVNLSAIRVGGKVVDIPTSAFAFDPNTGAGTIFDSGTVFTTLVKPAYLAVRNEVRRRMRKGTLSSLGGFDTCYDVPFTMSTITFIFSGMNMTLPQDNFLIRRNYGSTSCLAMAAAADDIVDSNLNVIASFQQQNHRILIDVGKSTLGVARELCS